MATTPKPKPTANKVKNGTGVTSQDNLKSLYQILEDLMGLEVLVGFPEETDARKPDPDEKGTPINNATIAYVQDNGSPELNIPPRPFMIPAMQECSGKVGAVLGQGALAVTKLGKRRDPDAIRKVFMTAGLVAQTALRKKINEGIPPPLSEATLRKRANRGGKGKGRKGAIQELANRAAGLPASIQLAKPLIDTGQLRNAAIYVVRKRSERK